MAEDLREGRLALALEDWAGSPQPLSIVYPSARFLPGRLRAFIDLVAEGFPQRRL